MDSKDGTQSESQIRSSDVVRRLVDSHKDADLRRGSAIRSKDKAMSDYWEGRRDGLNEAIGMMQEQTPNDPDEPHAKNL